MFLATSESNRHTRIALILNMFRQKMKYIFVEILVLNLVVSHKFQSKLVLITNTCQRMKAHRLLYLIVKDQTLSDIRNFLRTGRYGIWFCIIKWQLHTQIPSEEKWYAEPHVSTLYTTDAYWNGITGLTEVCLNWISPWLKWYLYKAMSKVLVCWMRSKALELDFRYII